VLAHRACAAPTRRAQSWPSQNSASATGRPRRVADQDQHPQAARPPGREARGPHPSHPRRTRPPARRGSSTRSSARAPSPLPPARPAWRAPGSRPRNAGAMRPPAAWPSPRPPGNPMSNYAAPFNGIRNGAA
jgi:hypothetical protein